MKTSIARFLGMRLGILTAWLVGVTPALAGTMGTGATTPASEVGFKQFVLGVEMPTLKKTNPMKCGGVQDDVIKCTATRSQTLLAKPVESVSLEFANGRLGKVTIVVYPGRDIRHWVLHGSKISGSTVEIKSYLAHLVPTLSKKLGNITPTEYQDGGLRGYAHHYAWDVKSDGHADKTRAEIRLVDPDVHVNGIHDVTAEKCAAPRSS